MIRRQIIRTHFEEGRQALDRQFPLVYYVTRPISFLVSPVVIKAGISANEVTVWSTVLGVGGIVASALLEWRLAGLSLILLWVLLDSVDGNVARATNTASARGAYIDTAAGVLMAALIFVLPGFAAARAAAGGTGQLIAPLSLSHLGLLAAVEYLAANILAQNLRYTARADAPSSLGWGLAVAKNATAMINILPICGILLALHAEVAFVLFYTAWNGAALTYVVVQGAKKPSDGSK